MSKASREELIRRGEQRLLEAGARNEPDDLETRLGGGLETDLAIAARLGALPSERSVAVLQRLAAAAADKLVQKEVKRALYRLEQRGIRIEKPEAPPARAALLAAPIEGYLSSVDGHGDQLVWMVKPRSGGGLLHLYALINDPGGLREIEVHSVNRKMLKEFCAELEHKHEIRMVETDWRYCDFLVQRAFAWSRARKTPMSGDYPAARAQLTREPVPRDLAPLVFQRLDRAAIEADAALVAQSAEILSEPEMRTWLLPREELAPYLEDLARIRNSPLVLSKVQQQERFEAMVNRAIKEYFAGERRRSYARRLLEQAYFFSATGRAEPARRAAAAALALAGAEPPQSIAFCGTVMLVSLNMHFRREVEQEEERAQSSLLVTPQQFAGERQRR